jgi:transcriptional regulator with XRE-family HTH domain
MAKKAEFEQRLLLGQRIRALRKANNLSMEALANIAEIELSQVSRIETAKINPKVSTLFILARALNVSPREFFNS